MLKPAIEFVLMSRWFQSPVYRNSRYSWPVEFVTRSIKEVGWNGFSVDTARTSLATMGQTLFEPPDVSGWELGQGWFSTGGMLARMNFGATLAFNQRFNIGRDSQSVRNAPEAMLSFFLDRMSPANYDGEPYNGLLEYLRAGATWPLNDTVGTNKAAGLTRLIMGSAEYQLI